MSNSEVNEGEVQLMKGPVSGKKRDIKKTLDKKCIFFARKDIKKE